MHPWRILSWLLRIEKGSQVWFLNFQRICNDPKTIQLDFQHLPTPYWKKIFFQLHNFRFLDFLWNIELRNRSYHNIFHILQEYPVKVLIRSKQIWWLSFKYPKQTWKLSIMSAISMWQYDRAISAAVCKDYINNERKILSFWVLNSLIQTPQRIQLFLFPIHSLIFYPIKSSSLLPLLILWFSEDIP